ncbi:hypothetical protein EC968_007160 [Mortierella alpina]|nr:hypothetical protein EC968_007160 [Mortierella alpina]
MSSFKKSTTNTPYRMSASEAQAQGYQPQSSQSSLQPLVETKHEAKSTKEDVVNKSENSNKDGLPTGPILKINWAVTQQRFVAPVPVK